MTNIRRIFLAHILVAAATFSVGAISTRANAATAEDLDKNAAQALQILYNPVAAEISKKAKAVLVFPNIVKAGLVFGGAYGEGVLKKGPQVMGYYNSASASWGLQAGAESYGYVVFLLTTKAVDYFNKTNGLEIGVGAAVVV